MKLAHSYTTQWPSYTKMTYPSFTFQYPDGWEIASENVSSSSEEVVLRKTGAEDVSVTFNFSPDTSFATPGHFEPLSITKVADSGFWPSYIQDTNTSDLGPFMVASVAGNWYLHKSDGMNQVEYYAVLPQSAQQTGFPGCKAVGPYVCFDYLVCVSFQSSNVHDMDDATRKEAIAILASFSDGSTGQNYEDALSQSNSRYSDVAYIFPDSDTRYLSESELNNRYFRDLYLARNEIFARHGRQFAKQELQDYFNGKSWYQGAIPPRAV